MDFNGKVVLLTGGASGIGESSVDEFLKNGVKGVAIADINPTLGEKVSKQFNEKYGAGKTIFIKTNTADKKSFEDAFRKTVEVFGHIDILVNNAGVFDEVNWERAIQINLNGTTHGCLLAINEYFPKYKGSEKSYIINISSMAGLSAVNYCPHYSSTKYAVVGLSRGFGTNESVINEGICVMAICPGATETPIFNDPPLVYKELYKKTIPNFKYQKPESVAKGIIEALRQSENGAVWFVDQNILQKIEELQELPISYSKTL